MVDGGKKLAALKITWLKKILSNDGKIAKILNALCPAVKLIKGQRRRICKYSYDESKQLFFGLMYSNITGIFVTDAFRFPSMILYLSVYIITLT